MLPYVEFEATRDRVMAHKTDAIVLGFAKSQLLTERSFAPLRQLHQEGVLRHIHYVTWDSVDIDAFVAPVLAMPEVTVTRVPQPDVQGTATQKTLTYQTHNLDVALSLVQEDNALVFKSRPDVVISADLLRRKIGGFSNTCGSVPTAAFGIAMPRPVMRNKVWISWADSNQPFFYEDAIFLGLKRDLRNFVIPLTRTDLDMLATPMCDHYYHIVRFAKAFLPAWPLFKGYLQHYRYITSNMDYRIDMMGHVLNGPYFLFLLIAHAWILHSQFHVDCGDPGEILFYPNTRNKETDWADPKTWRQALPYESLTAWQSGEKPGSLLPNVCRPFGRLMTDRWQKALFTQTLADMPRPTLMEMLEHTANCGDGRLGELETAFYQDLEQFYYNYMLAHQPARQAASPLMGAAAVGMR
jgi:hypothetical protein